ncbi:MAG: ubiquitin carboxyl-terminal hydrolase family protein [Chlamydiota bacterium]
MSSISIKPNSTAHKPANKGDFFTIVTLSNKQKVRIFAINREGECYRLSPKLLEEMGHYFRHDLTKNPREIAKGRRVYSRNDFSSADKIQKIFTSIQEENFGHAPLSNALGKTHSLYKTDLFHSLTQNACSKTVKTSGVTSFIRHPDERTCWALAALQTGFFTDPYLLQEVESFPEKTKPVETFLRKHTQDALDKDLTTLLKLEKTVLLSKEQTGQFHRVLTFVASTLKTPLGTIDAETFVKRRLMLQTLQKKQRISMKNKNVRKILLFASKKLRDYQRLLALGQIIAKHKKHAGESIYIGKELQVLFADLVEIYDRNGVSETGEDRILRTQFSTAEMLEGLYSLFERSGIDIHHLKTTRTYLIEDRVPNTPSDFTIVPINLIKERHQQPKAPLSIETLIHEQLSFTTLPRTLHFRMNREYADTTNTVTNIGSKKKKAPPVFVKKYVPNPIFFSSGDGTIQISSKVSDGQGETSPRKATYELQAFVIHGNIDGDPQTTTGALSSCHYVSCVKKGSQWFFINDALVKPISNAEAMRLAGRCAVATFKSVEKRPTNR